MKDNRIIMVLHLRTWNIKMNLGRSHQTDEGEEGSNSVMLACITGEGNRSGKDQEQKLLGEKRVS